MAAKCNLQPPHPDPIATLIHSLFSPCLLLDMSFSSHVFARHGRASKARPGHPVVSPWSSRAEGLGVLDLNNSNPTRKKPQKIEGGVSFFPKKAIRSTSNVLSLCTVTEITIGRRSAKGVQEACKACTQRNPEPKPLNKKSLRKSARENAPREHSPTRSQTHTSPPSQRHRTKTGVNRYSIIKSQLKTGMVTNPRKNITRTVFANYQEKNCGVESPHPSRRTSWRDGWGAMAHALARDLRWNMTEAPGAGLHFARQRGSNVIFSPHECKNANHRN